MHHWLYREDCRGFFLTCFATRGVQSVIDVRQNRIGQLSAFAKHPDLEFFLRQIGKIGRRHEPLLAPTPELRKSYREDKDWAAYEAGFLKLLKRVVCRRVSIPPAGGPMLRCCAPNPGRRSVTAGWLLKCWRSNGARRATMWMCDIWLLIRNVRNSSSTGLRHEFPFEFTYREKRIRFGA